MNLQKSYSNGEKNFKNFHWENINILAFDKDNTITPANKPMLSEMAEILARLTQEKIVVILTARDFEICQNHILEIIKNYKVNFQNLILGCSNGSQIFRYNHKKQEYVRASELVWELDISRANEALGVLRKSLHPDLQFEKRSNTMGAFFPPRDISDKERKNFDPTGERRKKAIEELVSLRIFSENCEIIPGGSTSIDVGIYDKEAGMRHLINFFKYSPEKYGQIAFFGDGFPGNDAPVKNIDGIHIFPVKNPDETLKKLQNFSEKFL